jgi:transposase
VAASARYRALERAGLLHPAPEAVTAEAFASEPEFFAAFDKVQVKYEMLRAHVVDGQTATATAAAHGYSRASFYLVAGAFERSGMVGLLDERPGRRGPLKLSPEVIGFLVQRRRERPDASGAELAGELERALGVRLHRRTVERALGGRA